MIRSTVAKSIAVTDTSPTVYVDGSAPDAPGNLRSATHPYDKWSSASPFVVDWDHGMDNGPSGRAGYSYLIASGVAGTPDTITETAGTNFTLMFAGIARRSLGPFARDEEFRVYIALLALASAIVWLELVTEDVYSGETAVRQAVFNLVTMMTTTGFASADFAAWPALTPLVLIRVLVIGASTGSTSGSIKLVRHVVIAKMLRREIDQNLHAVDA